MCWIVISKLLVIHNDGSAEEEENSRDYIALHVYKNNRKNTKVIHHRGAVKRSTYSPELSTMIYLELPSSEHLSVTNYLNLILDQHKRTRDLYYNIRVFSQVPFQTAKVK